MIRRCLFSLAALLQVAPFCTAQENIREHSDWNQHFDKFNASGTIVLLDKRNNRSTFLVFDKARAHKRYSPASTFKIPHTLFALDAGVVNDEFQVFVWDGKERDFAAHNQDQTLRSAMRNSTVWVYELFARAIGKERSQSYLKQIAYGNADSNTKHGNYWIDGDLAISAFEQVGFLEKLYYQQLPFRLEHQLIVKDIMLVAAEHDWILRAKSGWQGHYGWWVGWVERPNGVVFFALNIDTPKRMNDLYKREAITRVILQSIDALPDD